MNKTVELLIMFILFASYIVIGITYMGIFPDSKGNPNCTLIILWPISFLCFLLYSLLYGSYKLGKAIGKKLKHISHNNKYMISKEDRCDQIIQEILDHWDE